MIFLSFTNFNMNYTKDFHVKFNLVSPHSNDFINLVLTWWGTKSPSAGWWRSTKTTTWRSTTSSSNTTHSSTEFWFEVISSTSLVHACIATTTFTSVRISVSTITITWRTTWISYNLDSFNWATLLFDVD